MKSFARHIFDLLLSDECVIVPGLGGFVKRDEPAHYSADEELFYPPRKVVGFNQRLSVNDGLLAESYMKAEDVDYSEALRRVSTEVGRIKAALAAGKSCCLEGIGVLLPCHDGGIEFQPDENSNFSTEFFGYSAFRATMIGSRGAERHVNKNAREGKSRRQLHLGVSLGVRGGRASRVAASLAGQGLAAAATVLLFVLCVTAKVDLTPAQSPVASRSSLLDGFVFSREAYQSFIAGDASPIATQQDAPRRMHSGALVKPAVPVVRPQKADVKEQAAPAAPQAVAKPYTIVLASDISRAGAQTFVSELKKAGWGAARVIDGRTMRRVVYSSYQSADEAQRELSRLRRRSDIFADGWVLKM